MAGVKALTLMQPWAELVMRGFKKYETRSWRTSYRGPLAIHAAKSFPRWAQNLLLDEDVFCETLNCPPEELQRGMILGTVVLVDVFKIGNRVDIDEREKAFGDWASDRYGWQLKTPIYLPQPMPVKGILGLWEWPE